MPPRGALDGAAEDGPGARRILLASSSDGLTFTRSGNVLTDQANTPNIVVTESGRILTYYTGAALADNGDDAIAVAVSDDNSATWRYYKITFSGFPEGLPPVGDPDVVRNPDGTFIMYVTSAVGDVAGIHYATSTDGLRFAYGGVAFSADRSYVDSLTTRIGDTYHMYVLEPVGGQMLHATSEAGENFTQTDLIDTTSEGRSQILSNWLPLGDGTYRLFAFNLGDLGIRSFLTEDGTTLIAESGLRLDFVSSDLEASWIKDAAVARLSNGAYLMAYVSEIP